MSDPEVKCALTQPLTFENANLEYRKIIQSLMVRPAPIDKWSQHTVNTEFLNYGLDRRGNFERSEEPSKCQMF